jgi:DNA adenine methylase
MKPPMPYFGGKITLAPQIASLFPAHGHYVEPFAGSLAVLLAKPPSAHETVNDLDGDLMNFWRVLRDRPEEFTRACALTPHARAEQTAAYDLAGCDELERARRVWIQLTQGRAGLRRKTGWRHYVKPCRDSGSGAMPHYLLGYVDRIASAAERLRTVSLECLPALDLVEKYGRDRDVLLYVDPPYLSAVRESGTYIHEMGGEDEHRDLAAALHVAKATVVLSGYASDLYDRELYAGWDRHTMHATSGHGTSPDRTEVLWSNRPIGQQRALWDDDEVPA